MYTGESPVVSPLWGRSGEAPGHRLYSISMYITCVHLLNIYRNISQNNTINYSNNELLSHNSKQFSSSSQFWKEVGGGVFPIFGLFASDFNYPQSELLPHGLSSHSTSCSSMTSTFESLLSHLT